MTKSKVVLLETDRLQRAAACLKVLAHPARLRMVDILLQGEFPVREIARMCDLPAHQVCEHLRLMQGHGLLASDRRGREVYYRIVAPELPRIIHCIRDTCDQGQEASHPKF